MTRPQRTNIMAKKPLQLGRAVEWPDSPEKATLDRVPNPQAGTKYAACFTAPQFTSLSSVTAQHSVAQRALHDVPGRWLLRSESLNRSLAPVRNNGAFPAGRT